MRAIELQGINNVRDLGGIPVDGDRVVKSGILYRGSALIGMTDLDKKMLFETLGVTCVIDLRTGWEREAKPDAQAEGVENLHIPFYDLEKVGIEYTESIAGTKAVGRDIACDPNHYYRDISNPLTAGQMRKALDEIFSRATQGQAVYQHCSGGKDRSGIMSLLVLTALGASRESILEDYLATNIARDQNYDKMFERFSRFTDGDAKRAHELVISHRANPQNLQAFYESVDERYGSMQAFMHDTLGMNDERCARIREKCTRPA